MKPNPEQDRQRALGLFGKPSKAFLALNPIPMKSMTPYGGKPGDVKLIKSVAKRGMSAPALNKTEQRWQDAHPSHVPFPMSLRWGSCMSYKPDFFWKEGTAIVNRSGEVEGDERPILIETKGGHIRDRDIVRFKGCAAEWGWLFDFQMWQWKDRKWTRIY